MRDIAFNSADAGGGVGKVLFGLFGESMNSSKSVASLLDTSLRFFSDSALFARDSSVSRCSSVHAFSSSLKDSKVCSHASGLSSIRVCKYPIAIITRKSGSFASIFKR
jgi:hypothetical protein